MTSYIQAPKNGKVIRVELQHRQFKRPAIWEPIDSQRLIGVDTESLRSKEYDGELRTVLVLVCGAKWLMKPINSK
jgi:hypothetical protein